MWHLFWRKGSNTNKIHALHHYHILWSQFMLVCQLKWSFVGSSIIACRCYSPNFKPISHQMSLHFVILSSDMVWSILESLLVVTYFGNIFRFHIFTKIYSKPISTANSCNSINIFDTNDHITPFKSHSQLLWGSYYAVQCTTSTCIKYSLPILH